MRERIQSFYDYGAVTVRSRYDTETRRPKTLTRHGTVRYDRKVNIFTVNFFLDWPKLMKEIFFEGVSLKIRINTKKLNSFQSLSWLTCSLFVANDEYTVDELEGLLGHSERYSMIEGGRTKRDIIDQRLNDIKTSRCK